MKHLLFLTLLLGSMGLHAGPINSLDDGMMGEIKLTRDFKTDAVEHGTVWYKGPELEDVTEFYLSLPCHGKRKGCASVSAEPEPGPIIDFDLDPVVPEQSWPDVPYDDDIAPPTTTRVPVPSTLLLAILALLVMTRLAHTKNKNAA